MTEHGGRLPLPPTERHHVCIYKDLGKGGNGAFAITTTATDPRVFLEEAAQALALTMSATIPDQEFTLQGVLPRLCAIWAKLSGYKAPDVYEERLLICGPPDPTAYMTLLSTAEQAAAGERLLAEALTNGGDDPGPAPTEEP
jgi:hypothetical protein